MKQEHIRFLEKWDLGFYSKRMDSIGGGYLSSLSEPLIFAKFIMRTAVLSPLQSPLQLYKQ